MPVEEAPEEEDGLLVTELFQDFRDQMPNNTPDEAIATLVLADVVTHLRLVVEELFGMAVKRSETEKNPRGRPGWRQIDGGKN